MSLDFIRPDWPAPPCVRAICSTRHGGVSRAPYGSLNLGDHVGDSEEHVHENRRRLEEAMGAHPVFMRQVHGTSVAQVERQTPDGIEADACFTSQTGVGCTIMVADCLPVLLTDRDGRTVAAAHAGWRGLAGGVIEAAASRIAWPGALAWLGPCIGPREFEVGPEVKEAFENIDPRSSRRFIPHAKGKWLANLPGLARDRLESLGITAIYGNDGSHAWCTVSSPSRFFSHRRDRVSGRFAAAVWRV